MAEAEVFAPEGDLETLPGFVEPAPEPEPAYPEPAPPTPSEPAPAESPPSPEAGSAAPAPAPSAFSFGRRDPHEKARRLARVLVSDMIMYNPERHHRALETGSIKQDFEDEIRRSWDEYVDQVGEEIARSTSYFDEALNEILARGQPLFP